jgi:hypothetical protein
MWCACCRLSSELSYASDRTEDMIVVPLDESERLLSLQMALKCADVGHLAASLEVRRRNVGPCFCLCSIIDAAVVLAHVHGSGCHLVG